MEPVRTSNIHHAGLQHWLLVTVVQLLRQQEALPCLCLLYRDTWWYLPSNRQRNGKSERLDLVIYQTGRRYTCYLALISVWPLAVLSVFVMPFVSSFSFRRKVVKLPFPSDVIFGVKKINHRKAELQLRTVDASYLHVFSGNQLPVVTYYVGLSGTAQAVHKLWVPSSLCSVRLHDFDICNELKVTCEQLGQVASLVWARRKKKKTQARKSIGTMTTSTLKNLLDISTREINCSIINHILFTYYFTSMYLTSRWQCCNPSSAIMNNWTGTGGSVVLFHSFVEWPLLTRQWQITEAAASGSLLDCSASVGVLVGKTYPLLTTIKSEMRTKNHLCCFWLSMLWAVAESWVNVAQFYNLAVNVVLMLSQVLRRFMVAIQLELAMLQNLCLCQASWPNSTNKEVIFNVL